MVPLIFWVEDNPLDVQLLTTTLKQAGMTVRLMVAENALAAFRYMEGRDPYAASPRPPDLFLIDQNLPALSGDVVLREVRKSHDFRSVPAVVLTSSLNAMELRTCMELGASACIAKPAHLDGYLAVVARLRRHLPHSGAHRRVDGDPPPVPLDPPSSRFYCANTPA